MMENRYDRYKDSDIAWIGEIPEHWEVKRLKYFGNNYNGLTYSPNDICSSQEGIIVLRSSNIKDNKLCFDDNVYVNKEIPTKLLVNKGDILICSRNGSASLIGKAALIETDIKATFGAFMMIFKGNNICHKYLYYIVTSCISQYKWLFTTATINQLTSSMLGEIFAPFICNKLEQQSIAAYLDQKCGEIDELITLQEEMITKLQSYKQSVITEAVTKGLDKNVPLKDSGIEWIGEIPEHWNVRTLKTMLSGLQDGTHGTFENIVSNYLLLSAKNITDNGLQFSDLERTISENDYKAIVSNGYPQKGDILLCCVGTIGRCCIYNYDKIYAFQRSVSFLRTNKNESNRFLLYVLRSQICTTQFLMLARTSAQSGIYLNSLANLIVVTSPLSEQQSIADYLDKKCSEIDELISIKQQKIEKLKEYKKSLIFECVTGKRKVS